MFAIQPAFRLSFSALFRNGLTRLGQALRLVVFVTLVFGFAAPVAAQSASNPSGLPLPRFASTRSEPINVRVGPGTRYDISWVYVKSGQPVEIINEFDTWRKIRDVDGEEGWIHQNLLSGRRTGLITPWRESGQVALRAQQSENAGVRAWLTPHYLVEIDNCRDLWCAVKAETNPAEGRPRSYTGYVAQTDLWGVYPGEEFN
ncbi:SH3 domain-containing protein [Mariluticola halotolerans]|uniref:SH3 domain-containing protein n=1 Tax=Mariluticola halotolerans TaxID=2909283 RepID=UPI0026E1F4D8|nr:SH3 domain-containing protein [Mariluticola halotolerans]UJQ93538.1 SH3 domain-containing protein [Mariluticola halotolerans]